MRCQGIIERTFMQWLLRLETRHQLPGITVGADPARDLSWTVLGYDQLTCSYPEKHMWRDNLKADLRLHAEAMHRGLYMLASMMVVRESRNIQIHKQVTQLMALTQEWKAGRMVYGPLLGFAYVRGDELYFHESTDPLKPRLPMPCSAGVPYDYEEHITVALASIQSLWRPSIATAKR
jgi:hypothetical protein